MLLANGSLASFLLAEFDDRNESRTDVNYTGLVEAEQALIEALRNDCLQLKYAMQRQLLLNEGELAALQVAPDCQAAAPSTSAAACRSGEAIRRQPGAAGCGVRGAATAGGAP